MRIVASTQAEGLVVWAKVRGVSGDANQGESFWWQDVIGHRFGKTVWVMELDVHPPSGEPYRVQDEFKVPNKLFKLRHLAKGKPQFRSGLALPIVLDDRDPSKVTIDWEAFEASGRLTELYPEDESVVDTVRGFIAEVRSEPSIPAPDVPRPGPASHPAVEGVDYDQWVGAVLTVTRRMDPATLEAHYRSHGFPAGRGEAINAVWYERVQQDPVVNAWFLHDQASR